MMARMNRPATPAARRTMDEAIITLPMPRFDATVSTLRRRQRPASPSDFQRGEEVRHRTQQAGTSPRMSSLRCPQCLSSSSSSGSVVARPVATYHHDREHRHDHRGEDRAARSPAPNHSTKIGTTATFEIEGETDHAADRRRHRRLRRADAGRRAKRQSGCRSRSRPTWYKASAAYA